MIMTLIMLGALVVLLLVIAVLAYRREAQQAKHYAALQATIAEAATNQVEHRQKLDTQLNTLHEKQRHETITESAHLADRDDFDNDWSSGLPSDRSAVGDAAAGPAAADASGAAGDTERRTYLS